MEVVTTDWHTAGEPFRIVLDGVPEIPGATVAERRLAAMADPAVDRVRRLLCHEPRGHADMYGAFVVPPDDDGADLGVVFFHNEGYSTACGHGTIALATWAIDSGRVAGPRVAVDVPSGRLRCRATLDADGRVEAVRFDNVTSYAWALEAVIDTSRGPMTLDVGFGGAFYGALDVTTLGLRVEPAALPALIALQRELRPALEDLDLAFDIWKKSWSSVHDLWTAPGRPPGFAPAETALVPVPPRRSLWRLDDPD